MSETKFFKNLAAARYNVTTYDYDPNGNLETITYTTVSTPNGNVAPEINFTYYSRGGVTLDKTFKDR